jgi:hypothetical protein
MSLEGVRDAIVYSAQSGMDPKRNRQVARLQSVRRHADDTQAMVRAVRKTMATFIVNKPMELGLLFVCLAGVTTGINQLLYDDMFGPNSLFYLGRYPFFYGYLSGVILGVMSDIWLKLQMDELNDGNFGEVPKGDDAKRSYLSWFYKQFRQPGKNTFWQNQMHYVKIIWANIPAALVYYMVLGGVALGRLDLDAYFTGYFFAFFLPTNGFDAKIEQTYELSTGYFKKDIPEELVAHPRAQKYISSRASTARLWFNFVFKFYEDMLGHFLSTLQTITVGNMGSRSFVRFLFGGYTPTEWVFMFLQNVKSVAGFIPGVNFLADSCAFAFTNKYKDGSIPGLKE